ncbi:MAG: hypothetical protein Q9191_003919 [Dirinaria sp. TL-2023a]
MQILPSILGAIHGRFSLYPLKLLSKARSSTFFSRGQPQRNAGGIEDDIASAETDDAEDSVRWGGIDGDDEGERIDDIEAEPTLVDDAVVAVKVSNTEGSESLLASEIVGRSSKNSSGEAK